MAAVERYAVGDLAQLGGVSRRTVRYYVQEGLIPPPLGVGRGNHYGPDHLQQLLRVRAMQEAGRSLDEIRRALARPDTVQRPLRLRVQHEPSTVRRAVWRRLTLAPGVELHVAGTVRLPPPSRIDELAHWCRLHFAPATHSEVEDDNA